MDAKNYTLVYTEYMNLYFSLTCEAVFSPLTDIKNWYRMWEAIMSFFKKQTKEKSHMLVQLVIPSNKQEMFA